MRKRNKRDSKLKEDMKEILAKNKNGQKMATKRDVAKKNLGEVSCSWQIRRFMV